MLSLRRAILSGLAIVVAAAALAPRSDAISFDMTHGISTGWWMTVTGPNGAVWLLDVHGGISQLAGERATPSFYDDLGFETSPGPAMAIANDGTIWLSDRDMAHPVARYRTLGGELPPLGPLPHDAGADDMVAATDGGVWIAEAAYSIDRSQRTPLDRFAHAAPDGTITESDTLTPGSKPMSMAAGPDGNIWFLEPGTNSVGRMTQGGAVTEFPLPPGVTLPPRPTFGRPNQLTGGQDGSLYIALQGAIGRMTTDGVLTDVFRGGLTDLTPGSLAAGRDGNVWFTECTLDLDTVGRLTPSGRITRFTGRGLHARGCPEGMVADSNKDLWFDEYDSFLGGVVVFDPPQATTGDISATGTTTGTLTAAITPGGAATRVRFEYGTTTSYGATTGDVSAGDGDGPTPVSAPVAGLRPSATYHYRAVATSPIGTAVGADRTFTTANPPPPPPPPPPVDADGDGYPVGIDCDDAVATVHPGARDDPGDRVDQDCSGADAAFQRFAPHASAKWKTRGHKSTFTSLTVEDMPVGSSVTLTCRGKGCKIRAYTTQVSRAPRDISLVARLKRAKLARGAVVELRLSRPGYITTVIRWTVGPPPRASFLCLPPGAKKAQRC